MGAVIAAPSFAFAAEEAAENPGSWLGTMFFAINFLLFAGIMYYFAGPMACDVLSRSRNRHPLATRSPQLGA